MRTTLDIDDDILAAAKELARRAGKTAGALVSDLARSALLHPPGPPADSTAVMGFEPFASRGQVVTTELVRRLQDEED